MLLLAGGGLARLPAAGTLTLIADFVAPAALVPLILTVPVTVANWHLLAAPTRLGRRTLDAIEGYRLYLSVAEADRLDAAGREPAVTAALFERHQIGRASCRARVCPSLLVSVVAVSLKKKKTQENT